ATPIYWGIRRKEEELRRYIGVFAEKRRSYADILGYSPKRGGATPIYWGIRRKEEELCRYIRVSAEKKVSSANIMDERRKSDASRRYNEIFTEKGAYLAEINESPPKTIRLADTIEASALCKPCISVFCFT
ncbi:hypothetical protein, partial [Bacillus sp. 165]|uniref:hypothetical protein n=1 Tax=Bacillus sp. 165 TaxID=1529117 RepID=UPI001ADAFD81